MENKDICLPRDWWARDKMQDNGEVGQLNIVGHDK